MAHKTSSAEERAGGGGVAILNSTSAVPREIRLLEDWFRNRTGREAIYLPSGRVGLYVAFREWLRSGDRLLLSPIMDDVVFFTVLAAGLRPVFGPVDRTTGNLDPAAIPADAWQTLGGVLTSNLYGIPDRTDLLEARCHEQGIPLIEDACQAIDSRCADRRVGSFGTAAVYSLSKHIDGAGGILAPREASRRPGILERARELFQLRPGDAGLRGVIRFLLHRFRANTPVGNALARTRDRLILPRPERTGHRIPYELSEVLRAQREGASLDGFHRWVRVDKPTYRTLPPAFVLRATLNGVETFQQNLARRRAGAVSLQASGLTLPFVALPEETALFRVPLFVRGREHVLAEFARHGLRLDYIYDPPLHRYAPELSETVGPESDAVMWSESVLPVDPLHAGRFAIVRERLAEPLVPPIG